MAGASYAAEASLDGRCPARRGTLGFAHPSTVLNAGG
jgi:hypothetical protein